MNKRPQVFSVPKTVQLQLDLDISAISLNDDYAYVKQSVLPSSLSENFEMDLTDLVGAKSKLEFESVMSKGQFVALMDKGIRPDNMKWWVILNEEARELFREYGFANVANTDSTPVSNRFKELMRRDVFNALASGNASSEDVFMLDYSSHLVFRFDGEPLPVASGIELTSSAYNLEKAYDILKDKQNVRIIGTTSRGYPSDSTGWRANFDEYFVPADSYKSALQVVDTYDEDDGITYKLKVYFSPTSDEFKSILAKSNEIATQHAKKNKWKEVFTAAEVNHAIFALDCLGLRAGGASYFEDFFMQKRRSDEDNMGSISP